MKKVYYLTDTKYSNKDTGIGYKIYKQMTCIESEFKLIEPKGFLKDTFLNRILTLFPFIDRKHDYKHLISCEDISVLYIRYFLSNYKLISVLKKLKKRNSNLKIFIEIPTYPYEGEIKKFLPKTLKDKISRKKLHMFVDKIVTFSDDKEIFGIPTINISNGVDMKKISIRKCVKYDNCINLIAVAQMSFWHGFDRLISGLNEYYNSSNNFSEKIENFVVHLVGYGDEKVISEYNNLIDRYNLKEHVVFHGEKFGEELDKIYNKCQLSVDSLGRHRSNVFYNSSLKGKEYMAKGLPIISGVKTELDSASDFRYYFRVPADDSPVNFNDVARFYHNIYDDCDISIVSEEIRKYCEEHFEISEVFSPVIDEMKKEERNTI